MANNDEDDLNSFLDATGLTVEGEPEAVWRKEWVGMPEFEQGKQEAFATIVVRFRCLEDLVDFSRRIEQAVNPKTKSIWHPYKSHFGGPMAQFEYVDEP